LRPEATGLSNDEEEFLRAFVHHPVKG